MLVEEAVTKSKIVELESIRGLAALLVFFHHIPNWNETIFSTAILRNSHLMVDLFFVLSGYVICANYVDRIHHLKDVLRFQFLRLGRLYPIHLVVIFGFLAAEAAKYIAGYKLGIQFGRPAFDQFTLENIIANLTLTQAIGVNSNLTSINGPSWSISVEFYIYLLFAFIGLFSAYIKSWRIISYSIIFILALALLISADQPTYALYGDLLRGLTGFFLGCLAALYSIRFNNKKLMISGFFQGLVIFIIILFICIKPYERQLDFLIYPLSAALVIAIAHGANSSIKQLLQLRFIVGIGTISYSLYMCHYLVIWSVDNLLKHGDRFWPTAVWMKTSISYMSVVLITLLISYWAYRFIEKPSREKSRSIARDWFN